MGRSQRRAAAHLDEAVVEEEPEGGGDGHEGRPHLPGHGRPHDRLHARARRAVVVRRQLRLAAGGRRRRHHHRHGEQAEAAAPSPPLHGPGAQLAGSAAQGAVLPRACWNRILVSRGEKAAIATSCCLAGHQLQVTDGERRARGQPRWASLCIQPFLSFFRLDLELLYR
jgi:hypothetical protein